MARKRPAVAAVRQRDARTYRRLAAWARCHGYRAVTQHTVHHWVSAGLLAKVPPIATGFGQRATVQHVATGRQLLALCHYRYADKLGRHDLIGAQLWLDGFEVPPALVREAIAREFRPQARARHEEEDDSVPFTIARQRPIIDAMPRHSFDERAEVIDELAALLEDGEPPSAHGVEQIARAAGMTVRDTSTALQVLPRIDPEVVERATTASDDDLLSARAAWSTLIAHTTPDQHKNGRTRARIRLGLFIGVFGLDEHLRRPEVRSAVAPLFGAGSPEPEPR